MNPMARRQISEERKTAYYAGMLLMVIGFLIFASVFVTSFLNFGNFNNFDTNARSFGLRAFLGMGLMIAGRMLTRVGIRGLAGSGIILDPEQAREDVEPWARMAGGVIKDAVEESGLNLGRSENSVDAIDFDEKLQKLHQLYQDGILTEEEYQTEKVKILENS
jgi:hypothetical protein